MHILDLISKFMIKLEKNIIRETNVLVENKPIVIIVDSTKNSIGLKLKNMRGECKSINIIDLYNQMYSNVENSTDSKSEDSPIKYKSKYKSNDKNMIDLDQLRSLMMVTTMKLETKVQLDRILVEFINNLK